MARNGSDYVSAADIPPGYLARYEVTLSALYGTMTVSEAARRLGLSRLRFQTLMHRAQRAFAEALLPQPPGRPAKPPRETELEVLLSQRERELHQLREQLAIAENLFGTVGDMMRRLRPRRQRRSRQTRPTAETTQSSGDPEPSATRSTSSRPRWRRFTPWMTQMMSEIRRLDLELRSRRSARSRQPSAEARSELERRIRETNGLIGANALRVAVGVSRRQAAAVKHTTLTTIERERRAACGTAHVRQPGIVRGFDAMHVETTAGMWYLLVCADGSVPYRTTIELTEHYDGKSVEAILARDIAAHGAPLVYRFDRAKCHRVASVRELLAAHGILSLQGPPRYPWYYAQLERQNREHRAWLDALGPQSPLELGQTVQRMQNALNALWPRRTLDWDTPEVRWRMRPAVVEDRDALKRDVQARILLLRDARRPGDPWRLAIQEVLRERGYLEWQPGGRC